MSKIKLLQINNGKLSRAKFLKSPNCDERPTNSEICLLVIHNISLPPGEFGEAYVQALFTNQLDPSAHPYFQNIYQLKVSAHLYIRRNGELIQFVPFHLRAWHAGLSDFRGQSRCNDFSIGVELEGSDDQPFTAEQYDVLAGVSVALMDYYPKITADRICGHQHIAYKRKTDPGGEFDWNRYLLSLRNHRLPMSL